MKRLIALAMLLTACGGEVEAQAAAETLYARPAADCANNGNGLSYSCAASPGAVGAFRTLNVPQNAADETAGQLDPGDTLKVCGNFVAADADTGNDMLLLTVSGASNNRIRITGDCTADGGSSRATFNGGGSLLYGIDTDNKTHLTFDAIEVFNFSSRPVVAYNNSVADETIDKQLIFDSMIVHGVPSTGICVDMRGRNITFQNSTVYDCGSDAIFNAGRGFVVLNNTISQYSTATSVGDGVQMGGEVNGNIIRGNTINHTDYDTKYCVLASGVTDSGFVKIEDNICNLSLTATTSIGLLLETTGVIRKNTVSGGSQGIQCNPGAALQCDIIGNVTKNQTIRGLSVGSSATLANVFNNTVIGSPAGVTIAPNQAGVVVRNNILYGQSATGVEKTANAVEGYNLYYGIGGNNMTSGGTPTSPGTGSITGQDPLFVSSSNGDYRTRYGSPARRAGLFYYGCIDVRGRSVCNSPPDIGAYQASTGDQAAPR